MKHKFGFLTDVDNPLLPYFLYEARRAGVTNIFVICDSLRTKQKDIAIWEHRTNGQFCALDGTKISMAEIDVRFGCRTPYFMVESHNSSNFLLLCKELGLTCLFNAGTPRKLNSEVLSATPIGVLNVHPGVLPKYRGASAVEWALLNEDRVGNTAHFMDEGYDTGPIITVESYDLKPPFEYSDIRKMVYQRGCVLAAKVLSNISAGKLRAADAIGQELDLGQQWPPMPLDKFNKMLDMLALADDLYSKFSNPNSGPQDMDQSQ